MKINLYKLIVFILVTSNTIAKTTDIKARKYTLDASIIFSNNEKKQTKIQSIYPTLEEVNCNDETIVFSITVDKYGGISNPITLISGSENYFDEVQAALKKIKLDLKYADLDGMMSIEYKILKNHISKTIYSQAVELFEMKKYQKSFEKLLTIKGSDKQNVCVLMLKGNNLTKLEKFQESMQYYNQAIKMSPKNDRAYYSRAWRKNKLELYDEAIADVLTSMEIQEFWEDYYLLNKLYNNKEEYLSAIKFATLGFKLRHGSYFHNLRGWSYIANENYQLALIDFEKIIQLDPKNELGYTGKSRVLYFQEKYDEAHEFINKSIEIDGEDKYLLFDKAMIYDKQLKLDEAIDIYKNIIKNHEIDGKIFNNLGWALLRQNKFNDAIEVFIYAIQNNYESNYYRNNLATAYFLNEQYKQSITFFNKEIQEDKTDSNIFAYAGIARNYIKLKDLNNALPALENVINTDIYYTDAYYEFKYGEGNYLKIILQEFSDLAKTENNRKMITAINNLILNVNSHE